MRDIRDDLQDRANLIAEQISTAQGQLKHEHETMLEDLRSTLHSIHMVIGIEGRRLGSSLSGTKAESQVTPPSHHLPEQGQPQQPLSDALIRRVASVGAR